MHIKQIIWQHRRDFRAVYSCEHCGNEAEAGGYDDTNFHDNVIRAMVCPVCGKTADESYRPLCTKYPDGMVV